MMKKLFVLIFPLFLTSFTYADETLYQLGLDGLACPFCVYGIEKQLDKLDGIERMDTDIQHGRIALTMEEGASLNEQAVRDAVSRAGFTLRSFVEMKHSDPVSE